MREIIDELLFDCSNVFRIRLWKSIYENTHGCFYKIVKIKIHFQYASQIIQMLKFSPQITSNVYNLMME